MSREDRAYRCLSRLEALALEPVNPRNVLHRMGVRGARDEKWKEILKRDPCSYCGLRKPDMTVDHIEAKSRGHKTAGAKNGAPACFSCNQSKADDSLLTMLAGRLPRPRVRGGFRVEVRKGARRGARQQLGCLPPPSWWEQVADRIRSRSLRALWVKHREGREQVCWVVPVSSVDGVDLDLHITARSLRRPDGSVFGVDILGLKVGAAAVVT